MDQKLGGIAYPSLDDPSLLQKPIIPGGKVAGPYSASPVTMGIPISSGYTPPKGVY